MPAPNDELPSDPFERAIALAAQPINGQLPRPWMPAVDALLHRATGPRVHAGTTVGAA